MKLWTTNKLGKKIERLFSIRSWSWSTKPPTKCTAPCAFHVLHTRNTKHHLLLLQDEITQLYKEPCIVVKNSHKPHMCPLIIYSRARRAGCPQSTASCIPLWQLHKSGPTYMSVPFTPSSLLCRDKHTVAPDSQRDGTVLRSVACAHAGPNHHSPCFWPQ
jgi:hypothetical protein